MGIGRRKLAGDIVLEHYEVMPFALFHSTMIQEYFSSYLAAKDSRNAIFAKGMNSQLQLCLEAQSTTLILAFWHCALRSCQDHHI